MSPEKLAELQLARKRSIDPNLPEAERREATRFCVQLVREDRGYKATAVEAKVAKGKKKAIDTDKLLNDFIGKQGNLDV